MVRRKLLGLLAGTMVLGLASLAWGGVPDMDMSYATGSGTDVSVMNCPLGDGMAINSCMALPGITEVDATITLTVNDVNGDPIYLYPGADMWLASDTKAIVVCPGGSTADADTDIDGQTTFSGALFAGCEGHGVVILINGQTLNQAPLAAYNFNSPDIDCNQIVNLTDVILFTQAYYGTYAYNSDFYWDNILNLSDIVLLAQHMQHACP
jgi:hypothetical protein